MFARLVMLAALVALASAQTIYYCSSTVTYPADRYPVQPNGQFKEVVKGNFINIAYDKAVVAADQQFKARGIAPRNCTLEANRKVYGCYNSEVPGHKGRQYKGLYIFKYRLRYSCPLGINTPPTNYDLLVLQNVYTLRNGRYYMPTHGYVWQH